MAIGSSSKPDLDALRWKHRALLLFAPGLQDEQLKRQQETIKREEGQFAERDVKVFTAIGDSAEPLRKRFHINAADFVVILIGKDGGEKLRQTKPVDGKQLFGLIDSMPMRRNEMNKRD